MTIISPPPTSKVDSILKRFPTKITLGVSSVALPIGFLAYKHISWMETPQAKKRMAVHQATFWSGMAACITLLHGGAFWQHIPFTSVPVKGFQRILIALTGGAIGAGSFKGGLLLSNKLYPHEHKKADNNKIEEQPTLVVSPIPPAQTSTAPVATGTLLNQSV